MPATPVTYLHLYICVCVCVWCAFVCHAAQADHSHGLLTMLRAFMRVTPYFSARILKNCGQLAETFGKLQCTESKK